MTPKEHYDKYLSDIYTWMSGDLDAAVSTHREFFESKNIHPRSNGLALDLGAGTGIQSISLAACGFKVLSVDFSSTLLAELDSNKGELPITCIEADIINYVKSYQHNVELVVCMGDTLTHLPDEEQVATLIQSISTILVDGGKVIFSYRDLSKERKGEDRFIHVRSDDSRTLTCFIEYFPGHVMVHDIVTERRGSTWTQKVGSYPKLRLPVEMVSRLLRRNNLSVLSEELVRGMSFIVAEKSPL